jgi:cytochrome c oxidase cbb3-type subunit 3
MKAWRALLVVSLLMIITGGFCYLWESRSSRPSPIAGAAFSQSVSVPNLFPGGTPPAGTPPPGLHVHEEFSGYDVAEGKRLYQWFNCNTCHANGGGAMGPALMDDKWLYGSEPRNIFASIVEGRPNGMPSFRGRIPEAQVWQLVAYVRSMAGLVPKASRSSRNDSMAAKPPETMTPKQEPHPVGQPTEDSRSNVK